VGTVVESPWQATPPTDVEALSDLARRVLLDVRYAGVVATLLIASDLPSLRAELIAMLDSPERVLLEAASADEVFAQINEYEIDLAILDLQMSNMGAMAICSDLRNEESYGASDHTPVLMLLDRRPDVFLARRSGAEGFVLKPLDPQRVRLRGARPAARGDLRG
jgi:DNA-binding response OmpR family regulator